MTEGDWDVLGKWNSDPDVLFFAEGDDVKSRSLEETREIYRGVSRHAYTFIAELDGRPIGEGWLQEMNLQNILSRYPREIDMRRIDLTIGAKDLWGRGWGTRMIRLLTRFGFETCGADAIFACGIGRRNPRSRRAFEANGYVLDRATPREPGAKDTEEYDLVLTRRRYEELAAEDSDSS